MTVSNELEEQASLILAAEECEPGWFSQLHRFSRGDEHVLAKLMAHGPVLLRGGRGAGKSALMIEASRRLAPNTPGATAYGLYISLRHLELLRSRERAYERFLCELVLREVAQQMGSAGLELNGPPSVTSVQQALSRLSSYLGKRIVLFFDDAAHIGREASLSEFFDIFRTISSSTVSCKAAIYPGVTRFGTRFDIFNDATVLTIDRSEELPGFDDLFTGIFRARYPDAWASLAYSSFLNREAVAAFLGRAVLGNMRAFIFACNALARRGEGGAIGLGELGDILISLAGNHYWPLLEELKPKLGVYEPMVEPACKIATAMFEQCGKAQANRFALVHRDITEKLAKPFEMLEYVGFIARREASRAMKSGGRGARFVLNLCNLLEQTPGARLTRELFDRWTRDRTEPVEFHRGSELQSEALPTIDEDAAIAILELPIDRLKKSNAYPYGLPDAKIRVMQDAGIRTVGDLAAATDDDLRKLHYVGPAMVRRVRNVVGQAIWM